MPIQIGQKLGLNGQYEIVALLGEGGMASVYRAHQTAMKRDVAVKVIESKLAHETVFLQRFEREAQTVAALSHPYILKVFDYGQHDRETLYLVMELLTGGSLADLIRQKSLAPEFVARLLDQIAQALDYAHDQGIIHRDLKPQNVLLDTRQNAILTDFGIAKLLNQSATLTASGTVLGTPAYMAPEQWRNEAIDARTDVYALGIMAFEMLSGKLPFVADTPHGMMYAHLSESPPSLARYRTGLSPGAEAVIGRALTKDPTARYQSAGAFAEAMGQALTDKIATKTPNKAAAFYEKTEPGAVSEAKTALPTSVTSVAPIRSTQPNTVRSSPLAFVRRLPLINCSVLVVVTVGVLAVVLVSLTTQMGSAPPATATISFASTSTPTIATSGAVLSVRTFNDGHVGAIYSVAFSPDGQSLATGSSDGTTTLWNLDSPSAMNTFAQDMGGYQNIPVDSIAFSPDGQHLLTSSRHGAAILWDIQNNTQIRVLAQSDAITVNCVAFSANGQFIATGNDDDTVVIWNANTGAKIQTLKGHTFPVNSVAFSPDNKDILTGSTDTTAILWNIQSGAQLQAFKGHYDAVTSVAFSPDGKRVLTGSSDGTALLWDAHSGDQLLRFGGYGKSVNSVAFAPDGKRVLTGGEDGIARLWDVDSAAILSTFNAATTIYSVAFSKDGQFILSGGYDGSTRLWDTTSGQGVPTAPALGG